MKKTYKNPTLTVLKIETAIILAGSTMAVDPTKETSTQMSRGDLWDDED